MITSVPFHPFADTVSDNGTPESEEEADEEKEDTPDEKLPLKVIEVRDGIRIFENRLMSLNVAQGRKIYKACMYDRYSTHDIPTFHPPTSSQFV
jgi:hypothetical protein